MKHLQPVLSALVVAAGLVTLLASSLTEEQASTPPVPVTVNYALQSSAAGLSRELETRRAIVSAMRLAGSYVANSGDGLTLDRSIVNLDMSSAFDLEIVASGDELLTGMAVIDITSTLDLRLDGTPTVGRFTSNFGGTTTVVELTASNVDLLVGAAPDAVSLTWSDFVAREGDAGADLHERMASAAYNVLPAMLRAALVVEEIVNDIENKRSALNGMFDSPVSEICNNPTAAGDDPEVRLRWTADVNNTGDNQIGDGDGFEARYFNCYDPELQRYLDGTVLLSDYFPDSGAGLRTLAINATDLSQVYVANDAIARDVEPGAASPRYNGELSLRYEETPRTP